MKHENAHLATLATLATLIATHGAESEGATVETSGTLDTDYWGVPYVEIPETYGVRFVFAHDAWYANVSLETAVCLGHDADQYHTYRMELETYCEEAMDAFGTALPDVYDVLESNAMCEATCEEESRIWEVWVCDDVARELPEYVRDFFEARDLELDTCLTDIYKSGDLEIASDGGYFNMTLHINGRGYGARGIADAVEHEIEFWLDDHHPEYAEDWSAAQNAEY